MAANYNPSKIHYPCADKDDEEETDGIIWKDMHLCISVSLYLCISDLCMLTTRGLDGATSAVLW